MGRVQSALAEFITRPQFGWKSAHGGVYLFCFLIEAIQQICYDKCMKKNESSFGAFLFAAVATALASLLSASAHANPPYTRALDLIEAATVGSWVKLNTNALSAVWTPVALNPDPDFTPETVINAWGGLAWDTQRGKFVAHGGGHANYKGNEVYTWDVATGQWSRGSLPSALVSLGSLGATGGLEDELMPIDRAAPNSCHQYATPTYLPVVDRVVYFCGAGHLNARTNIFARADGSVYYPGPFFWNPTLADANKVGGTQGSHVRRTPAYSSATSIAAGNMWQARGLWQGLTVGEGFAFLDSNAAYRTEGGQDVVYITATPDNSAVEPRLYRYAVHPSNNPALDTWQFIGEYWTGYGYGEGGAFIHPAFDIFVKPSATGTGLTYWKLDAASIADPTNNRDLQLTPTVASGTTFSNFNGSALSWDPKRGVAAIWQGGTALWKMQPPTTFGTTGWVVSSLAVTNPSIGPAVSINAVQNRMRYLAALDAYVAIAEGSNGDVWAYKPSGWSRPGANAPPTAAITAPAPGVERSTNDTFSIEATAADIDGTIARVDLLLNGTVVATRNTVPYSFSLTAVPAGYHDMKVVAVDNAGAQAESATQKIVVLPAQGTVVRHVVSPVAATQDFTTTLRCLDSTGLRAPTFSYPSGTDTSVAVYNAISASTRCIASVQTVAQPTNPFLFGAKGVTYVQSAGLNNLTLRSTALASTSVTKAVTAADGTMIAVTCERAAPGGLVWRKVFNVAADAGLVTASPVPDGTRCTVPAQYQGRLF
jgi:hypothetical protein